MREAVISVIITAYNAARFLNQAIQSALRQDYLDKEIIVVDDGSLDETPQIVGRYATSLRSIRQENAGACAARNRGLLAVKRQYVKFLDSDDVLAPGRFRARSPLPASFRTRLAQSRL